MGYYQKIGGRYGIEFLGDRLQLVTSFYSHITSNQLLNEALTLVTGQLGVVINLPAKVRNSGLEVEFHSANVSTNKFLWSTDFNISLPKNKLMAFPDIETSDYRGVFKVGESLNGEYAMPYLGVDPQTGKNTFG